MRKLPLALLILSLLTSSLAHAQYGGGGGGGVGGGHGRRGGSQPSGGPGGEKPPAGPQAPTKSVPVDQIDIIGVVQAIGPEPDRITIRYDANDGLNWPAGAKPFVVSKTALLQGVTVGEKVRFRLESQQIASLKPF